MSAAPPPRAAADEPAIALSFSGVRKTFGDHVALDGVSFEVRRGEVFGLLGPNGAGKTTLIRLALDILRADEGQVRVLGADVREADHDRVSYLPEERGLYRQERVSDVLAYLARLKGVPRKEARARSHAWLAKVGLADVADKKVDQLSKGMSQRAQIAAALVADPELAILDEPFSGLDPVEVGRVLDLIRERRASGATTILATHRMDRVEEVCDRVALLHRGRRVRYGTVDEIRGARRNVYVELEGALPEVPGIEGAVETPRGLRLELSRPAPEVLLELLRAGSDIAGWELVRWEIERPSLEEIFVEVVSDASAPGPESGEAV